MEDEVEDIVFYRALQNSIAQRYRNLKILPLLLLQPVS